MDNEVLKCDERILTASSLLRIDNRYYEVIPLYLAIDFSKDLKVEDDGSVSSFNLVKDFEFRDDVAYLSDIYYYLYRGNISDITDKDNILPGIYFNDETSTYLICEPETEKELEEYSYLDKITRYDADEIRNAVLNHEVIIFNTPDSAHSSIPPESIDDDILKRLIKRAIVNKGIDLDQYKVRFASKNMLFNTKQVLRGPNRLSMLLFDRCTEALNLKYTIIIEEGGGEIIGHPLEEPIIISSQDYIDMNIIPNDEEK